MKDGRLGWARRQLGLTRDQWSKSCPHLAAYAAWSVDASSGKGLTDRDVVNVAVDGRPLALLP
jgi:hypothetical protein